MNISYSPSLASSQPLFGGYRLIRQDDDSKTQSPKVKLHLPGHKPGTEEAQEMPYAEAMAPHDKVPYHLPLRWNDDRDQWESVSTLGPNARYRFIVNGQPHLDLLETVHVALGDKKSTDAEAAHEGTVSEAFNRVSPSLGKTPSISRLIFDVFQDALTTRKGFDKVVLSLDGKQPTPTHFHHFEQGMGSQNLSELGKYLPDMPLTILPKPFIGGDDLSGHHYWTQDPYVLNNTFKDKHEFRKNLVDNLKLGIKYETDLAFVNEGLNGLHMQANLVYGHRSPFWNWFRHAEASKQETQAIQQGLGRYYYPPNASEDRKQSFGILPSRPDLDTGDRRLNFERFDYKIHNDPGKAGYKSDRPTYIQLFDPALESLYKGTEVPHSDMSVHPYAFPVAAKEVLKKQKQLATGALTDTERKKLFSDWPTMKLTVARADDSGMKWDGQIDAALLNTHNPEVINYLSKAAGYWSRVFLHTPANAVAHALKPVLDKEAGFHGNDLNPIDAKRLSESINSITRRPGHKADLKDKQRVLPPITLPEHEIMSHIELQSIIRKVAQDSENAPKVMGKQGALLSGEIFKNIPIDVVPLPALFKSTLCMPGFRDGLQKTPGNFALKNLTSFLSQQSGANKPGRLSIEQHMANKLQAAVETLPVAEQEKLAHPGVRALVADQLGEHLYTSLMTGLDPVSLAHNKYSKDQIHEAFYKTVPSLVRNAPPETGAVRLNKFLQKQMHSADILAPEQLAIGLKEVLHPLSPLAVETGLHLIQKRELGMDVRIDAAKEVGDMARIRNAPTQQLRDKAFKEEANHIVKVWNAIGNEVRAVYPKSKFNAELTEINKLSDDNREKELINRLFAQNTFTSMPNMKFTYSQIMQLVNYDQRPDEVGGSRLNPSEFIERSMHGLSKTLPSTAMFQMQNLTSSHDYNTSTHSLMVNPALYTMDLLPWWGLKNDFQVACSELQNKACFTRKINVLDKNVNVTKDKEPAIHVRETIEKLSQIVQDSHSGIMKRLPPDTRKFFDQANKEKAYKAPNSNQHPPPTPREMKGRFIDELFKALTVAEREDLGLARHPALGKTSQQKFEAQLKTLLKDRMMEPSEAKAMRGVVNNAILALGREEEEVDHPNFWAQAQKAYKLDDKEASRLKNRTEASLYNAMDKAIAGWGRHFGYQQPDLVVQHIFEHLDSKWAESVPALKNNPKLQKEFGSHLQEAVYSEMLKPVLPKLLKIFATQNALPGNPSIYLPDWFAQGGGEFKENIFVQNRGMIRLDKHDPSKKVADDADDGWKHFSHQPQYQAFIKQAKQILETRAKGFKVEDPGHTGRTFNVGTAALNDGILLNVPADDENGVLPIVRDNGREQVITLVNTGQPQPLDWLNKAGAEGLEYAKVQTNEEPLTDYRSTLVSPELVPDRTYRDAINGERFKLEEDGSLSSLKNPEYGIDIRDFRILVRELKHAIR